MAKENAQAGDAETLPARMTNAQVPAMIEPTPELLNEAYAAVLDGTLPPEVGNPEITSRAIAERIRNSDTFDKVFQPQNLTPWQQYEGEAVTIGGFHLNPSGFEDGSAVYAVVEIAREDGEFFPVSVGGKNVMMQLLKAWEQSWFPFRGVLVAKATATPGRKTLWIEAA